MHQLHNKRYFKMTWKNVWNVLSNLPKQAFWRLIQTLKVFPPKVVQTKMTKSTLLHSLCVWHICLLARHFFMCKCWMSLPRFPAAWLQMAEAQCSLWMVSEIWRKPRFRNDNHQTLETMYLYNNLIHFLCLLLNILQEYIMGILKNYRTSNYSLR